DADYVASGNIVASVHPDHDVRLESEAAARRALGARASFVTPSQMRARGIPSAFRCGLLQEPGGTLDPGAYVRGLADAARRAGVRVFEGTDVTHIAYGKPVRAETRGGHVAADQMVIAANAYTPGLGLLPRAVIPLRVCCIETEPLSPDEREAIGWRGGEGVSTTHAIPESYRWTPRGGIAAGTRSVRYARGSALSTADDARQLAVLEGALRARLPMLASTRIHARWGGWIALTTDNLPRLGTTGPHGNVFYALGYSGHGVAQATLLGAMLAARMRGRPHELAAPFERKAWNWPVEPLRWIGAGAVLSVLMYLDRRLDRSIAALETPAAR
ncbi:MAG: FAD-binding oxidoreductase, partial [Candidatus Binatia bacterium]